MDNQKSDGKKVSIRIIIVIMVIVALVISVLLLTATFKVATGYSNLNVNMNDYTKWQQDANNLQIGSDYLTEQVRCFVVTGKREYLDNYFIEANVTHRRDNAVESVRKLMGDTDAYRSLVNAMAESVDLMNREYYAMRMAIEGYGLELSEYPQVVQKVKLSSQDQKASAEEQRETARTMVFDDIYHSKKVAITDNIQKCLDAMDTEMEKRQREAQHSMQNTLQMQRVLIAAMILTIIITILLFMLLVVTPLLRAVTFIQKDESLPVAGSREFQFLANEYNAMHRTNASQKEELAYEASHDILTGVYNRNGYDAIQQSVDWDECALVLFDLDRFKPINDNFGHKMGDRVLARTARVIQNAFRAQDYVCRIGGDEFAVIMVNVRTDSGELIRDKVHRINDELSRPEDDIPGIHVSSGAAYGALISDFDALFREADAALYRIKNGGGGDCEVCS